MSKQSPLFKGQGFRLFGLGGGLVIGLVAVLATRAFISDEPVSSVHLIGFGIGAVLALGATVVGLLLGRKLFGQRLELAMWPVGATKWRHGYAEVSPGHMRFFGYKWQVRFVSSKPHDFLVHEVGPDSGQWPSKKQMWSVNPSLHVIEIDTDQGTLHLGLQAHQVDEVRAQLLPIPTSP